MYNQTLSCLTFLVHYIKLHYLKFWSQFPGFHRQQICHPDPQDMIWGENSLKEIH